MSQVIGELDFKVVGGRAAWDLRPEGLYGGSKRDPELSALVGETDEVGHSFKPVAAIRVFSRWLKLVYEPGITVPMLGLGGLFVEPNRRGVGIGTKLLKSTIAWALQGQRDSLFIGVITEDSRIYEKVGFSETLLDPDDIELKANMKFLTIVLGSAILPAREGLWRLIGDFF